MKKFLTLVLAVAMTASLAACGSSSGSSSSSASSSSSKASSSTAASTEEAAATETSDSDTYKIGVSLIQSGDFAGALAYQKPAIEMVVDKYNENGGINGKQIEVIYADDQGDSSLVPQRLSELKAAGAQVICGPLFDTTAPAAAEWAAENEVPVILTCNAPTSITIDQYSDYIYCTGLCAWAEARVLEKYVIDNDIKSVYFLQADGDVPSDIYNFFWKEIGQYAEVENKGQAIVSMSETDYTTLITAALNTGAELVACPINGGQYTSFTQQADQLGAFDKTIIFGFGNIDLGALQPFGADYPENSWGYATTDFGENATDDMKAFVEEFIERSEGTYPNELSVHWYNAMEAAIQALASAGDDLSEAHIAECLQTVTWTSPEGEEAHFNTWDHLLAAPLSYAVAVYDEDLGFYAPQATPVDTDFLFYTEEEFEEYKASR